MSMTLDLMKGTVQQDVAYLGQRILQDGALPAANQIADLVLAIAQIRVRVETGALRDSGRVEHAVGPIFDLTHKVTVQVKFGGQQYINPKTGKPVTYAAIVEAKYPFLRPAWEDAKSEAIEILKRNVVASVER